MESSQHLILETIAIWDLSALDNMLVFSPVFCFFYVFILGISSAQDFSNGDISGHIRAMFTVLCKYVYLLFCTLKKSISLVSSHLFLLFQLSILRYEFFNLNVWSHFKKASILSFKIVRRYFYLHEMLLCQNQMVKNNRHNDGEYVEHE